MSRAIDGLIREVQLDRANGLVGKTGIHPSHVAVVHALSVVSHEEYRDATRRAASGRGRRGAGLRVPEQDERGPPAPRVGAAHAAAGRGVRGGRRGHRRSSTCSPRACPGDRSRRIGPAVRAARACGSTAHAARAWSGWRCGATRGGPTCWCRRCWASTCRPTRGWCRRRGCCSVRLVADRAGRPAGAAGAGRSCCAAAVARRPGRGRVRPARVRGVRRGRAAAGRAGARLRRDGHRARALRRRGPGRRRYLHSTRRPVAGVAAGRADFTEEHSHATEHLLLPADPALLRGDRPLVLVDDELTTGRTALNTIRALHRAGAAERYVRGRPGRRAARRRGRWSAGGARRSGRGSTWSRWPAGAVELPADVAERAAGLRARARAPPTRARGTRGQRAGPRAVARPPGGAGGARLAARGCRSAAGTGSRAADHARADGRAARAGRGARACGPRSARSCSAPRS